jgi:DNA-binding transcriptional MerR regulator
LDDRELSPREVAEELNVSTSTVRRWAKRGIFKPTRVLPVSNYHRYSRKAVEDFRQRLERGEIEAKAGS